MQRPGGFSGMEKEACGRGRVARKGPFRKTFHVRRSANDCYNHPTGVLFRSFAVWSTRRRRFANSLAQQGGTSVPPTHKYKRNNFLREEDPLFARAQPCPVAARSATVVRGRA